MALKDFYKDAQVQRATTQDNGIGGKIETWTTLSNIKALINQASSSEIEMAKKKDVFVTHKMYCDTQTDIKYGDRVVFLGENYRVVSEPKDTVFIGHHLKVMLQKVGVDNE